MPQISAVLIVKNEAPRLASCLEALRNLADEIIVADTGSSDDTLALARQFTPHCHEIPWENDFAAARNRAIAFAKGPWILSIDADEVVADPERARDLLEEFIHHQPAGATGTIQHRSPTGTGANQTIVTGTVERFFEKAAYRFSGIIHEQLVAINGPRGPVASTGVVVAHSGYEHREEDPDHKGLRNLPLLRQAATTHPGDAYYPYQLGRTLFTLKRYPEAIAAFEAALRDIDFAQTAPAYRNGAPVGRETLTTLLTSLTYALANSGRLNDAENLLTDHIALNHHGTHWADFYHACGYVALMLGDIERAKAAYTESMRRGPVREDVAGTGSYASAYHLGLLAEAEGDLPGAIGHYATALQFKPDHRVTLDRYIDFMVEQQFGVAPNIQAHASPEAFHAAALRRLKSRLEADDKTGADFLITTIGLLTFTNKRFANDLLEQCQQLRMRYGQA
ncbi:MAG: glycosyltransferase [Candidatus Hydrogenedentes bacterium]|nr:glycosyltransferase [Candidatus Hydrogenedentota bacterium]